nr:hypothetical protein [Enterobacter cancerogenus]
MEFIQRILSEVGIYWRTVMDNSRGLDAYIFADSQLHYHTMVKPVYAFLQTSCKFKMIK